MRAELWLLVALAGALVGLVTSLILLSATESHWPGYAAIVFLFAAMIAKVAISEGTGNTLLYGVLCVLILIAALVLDVKALV
jgi:hypothetical protein